MIFLVFRFNYGNAELFEGPGCPALWAGSVFLLSSRAFFGASGGGEFPAACGRVALMLMRGTYVMGGGVCFYAQMDPAQRTPSRSPEI